MKYEILLADDVPALVDRVNRRIGEGWTPQGGMAAMVWRGDNGITYTGFYQAMIHLPGVTFDLKTADTPGQMHLDALARVERECEAEGATPITIETHGAAHLEFKRPHQAIA